MRDTGTIAEEEKRLLARRLYSALAEKVETYSEAFREFVQALCNSELAKEAYLVGSRARGDNLSSSDFDIVVIVEDEVDPLDVAIRVRLLKKKSIPLDIVALRRGDLKDPIYRKMLENAKKIC